MRRTILALFFFFSAISLFGQNFTSGYKNVQNVKWYYETYGEGEPLLFLHGGLESCSNYSMLISKLASNYKIIAVDRRGHGKSYDDERPYNYSILADEVKEFIDSLNLQSVYLIGYSDGGNIGFHLCSRYPELVKKFIAVSPNYKVIGGMTAEFINIVKNMKEKDLPEIAPFTIVLTLPIILKNIYQKENQCG